MSLVTLKEIAVVAGTDTGTVSRVLSGGYRKARISESRAAEIRAVAEKLKWRPNVAARSTRTGRFDSIAVVSSTVLEFGHYLSPWFLNFVHDEAHERNHLVNYVRLSPEQIEGTERAKILEEMSVDGWLLNFNTMLPASLTRQIESLNIPAVLINNLAPVDAVRPADLDASRRLTEMLIRGGRRRIAYFDSEARVDVLGRPDLHYSVMQRQQGYQQVMAEAGLEPRIIRPREKVTRAGTMAYAMTQMDALAAADAIITYNPFQATPLLILAERSGRRVPDDLPIATFNDTALGDRGMPLITAVMPWQELARIAVGMLMQKIESPTRQPLPSQEIRYDIHLPSSAHAALSSLREGDVS